MPVKHSLVVPCYNEEGNVEAFFAAACAAMEGYTADFELVFVNDGSADGTARKLDALYEAHPDRRITVIHFSRNFGKEAAMYAGLEAARGEYVTLIDADLQQRPEVAVEMGRILDEDADCDMVAAYPAKRQESPFLKWCKTSFYRVINRVTDVELIADASDFRTLRRRVVEALLSLPEYHRFSKGLFAFVGFVSRAIPYEVQERLSGSTKWNFFKLLRYALDGIMAYTDLPLRLPLYVGGGLMGLGALGLLIAWIVYLAAHAAVAPWALAALLVLLCGVLLCFLGVQGAYIGKIHAQVKRRPVYIARRIRTRSDSD
ncbi:MAG: glycosyltransferase family 2 protein [Clostridia bacterium]|nr:glycosyltransferase family 2 protein [Clostridia bacterium]